MPSSCDCSLSLRRAIERLDGLPLRPATARAFLTATAPLRDLSGGGRPLNPELRALTRDDPGWALWELSGEASRVDPLELISRKPWWRASSPDVGDALLRLWRHAVATSWVAERLALESVHCDAELHARLGLLHNLGLWAIAAVAPELLPGLLRLPQPDRRGAERAMLGTDLANLGRDLAERWIGPTPLSDVAWLHGDSEVLPGIHSPGLLARVQKAREWADRTPWSLGPGEPPLAASACTRLRRLIVEVQLRTGTPFVEAALTAQDELLVREHARLAVRQVRLEQENAECLALIRTMANGHSASGWPVSEQADAAPEPAGNPDVGAAWVVWREREAGRERLAGRLDALTDAYRSRLATDAQHRSRERLESLAEFAAGAAHELNNPLAVILGRAQLLLAREKGDIEASRSLREIVAQAQRTHRMLRDLIYVARPPVPESRLCQPDEVLRASVLGLSREADAAGVRLHSELPEPATWGWSDPDALRHLADVLVRNAIEASRRDGTVRVTARSQERTVFWTVSDAGRGLSSREARLLFDPFFCGRQAGRGLGLGLSRASRFVASVGGQFRWSSRRGQGTTFQVKIPLPKPSCAPPPATNGGGPHVLRTQSSERLDAPSGRKLRGD